MREEKRYYVDIMASRSLTLYTGVTGDIYHRALQHKAGEIEGFTKKYHINRLRNVQVCKQRARPRETNQGLDTSEAPCANQDYEPSVAGHG